MRTDPGSVRHSGPIAYFMTWATYGSWLPGDARGWTDRAGCMQAGDSLVTSAAVNRMTRPPVTLTPLQRHLVVDSIDHVGGRRRWSIHARTCRTQHVHAVLTAVSYSPSEVINQLKAWSTRRLNDDEQTISGVVGRRWWARGGSVRLIFDQRGLENVVEYVLEYQDK